MRFDRLYRLQQRLAITRRESLALLVLLGLLLTGLVLRHVQEPPAVPRDGHAETERLFAEGLAALEEADPADPEPEEAEAATTEERELTLRVDLNAASAEELEQLPRIGPALAERILDYRTTVGPFRRVDELQNVRGIGPRTLEGLAPLVYVGTPSER